ncbi:MAG TPA: A24 family peptidase [Polyangiaceae bacterium]|nr:A24 family peptidase [Polyangiaceae bacterium]
MTLASAWTDARTGRIPNWLTFPALPLGLALGAIDAGWLGLGSAALGALLCFGVPYTLFRSSRGTAIGGGDVKLFTGLGALLGPRAGLEVELASLVLLAVFALLALTWRGQLLAMLRRTFWLAINWALPRQRRRQLEPELMLTMRMGPAVCVATWGFATLEHLQTLL